MTVGSLFSGVGGLDLGFERAGFEIAWVCEKDEFCRKVLSKHWPTVPIYDDVTTLRTPPAVDVLAGGFPCQDISEAGKGAGLDGERSGLWWEYLRLIRQLRPRYVVAENVSELASRGLDAVLGSLAELGYDAEWETLSSCAFGAAHTRERVFVVAYRHSERKEARWTQRGRDDTEALAGREWDTEYLHPPTVAGRGPIRRIRPCESDVAGIAHGVPDRVDRNRALGNAVDPHVAEYVARCVRQHAEARGEWGHRHDTPPMKAAV